jgi:hypothetical protein
VLVVTFAKMGIMDMTLESSITTTQRILWKVKAIPDFTETSLMFCGVSG